MLEQQCCLAQLGLERAAFKKKRKEKKKQKGEQKWRGRTKGGEECDSPTLNSRHWEAKITYTHTHTHTHRLTHRRNNPWATWTYLICLSFSRGINFYFLICSVSLNQISSVHFPPVRPVSCLVVWQPEFTYSYLCGLTRIRLKLPRDHVKVNTRLGGWGMICCSTIYIGTICTYEPAYIHNRKPSNLVCKMYIFFLSNIVKLRKPHTNH